MSRVKRTITIDYQKFYWRFDDQLIVWLENPQGRVLYVNWRFIDWCEPEGPGNPPQVITPKFVERAIRFAMTQQWPPDKPSAPMKLWYDSKSDTFKVVE